MSLYPEVGVPLAGVRCVISRWGVSISRPFFFQPPVGKYVIRDPAAAKFDPTGVKRIFGKVFSFDFLKYNCGNKINEVEKNWLK